MTDHLMNSTLSLEQAKLAAYYGTGMVQDNVMLDVAHAIAAGELTWAEGVGIVVDRQMATIPEPTVAEQQKHTVWREDHEKYTRDPHRTRDDRRAEIEDRVSRRLGVLTERITDGLLDAPLAVLRQDIDPRVLAGLGIEADGLLSKDEINALLAGRRADGGLIEGKRYIEERKLPVDPKTGEERFSTPIGSYDFCPTPCKSVSVAWAMSGPVEQAMIFNAHVEAAREAVGYIASDVGRVRLGAGGQDGTEAGNVAWLEFTHHTSRRVQIKTGAITTDTGPGDPDLHTHFLIPNAVFSAESDKVGSLDTAAIGGFIFEADAFYHARLGQKLRDAGFEVELDHRTGAARMTIVPEAVCELFSKRTRAGEAAARKMAAAGGLDWDGLAPEQRATRIKNATQSFDQKQKGGKDDVADVASWQHQAKAGCGWEAPKSLMLYGPVIAPLTPEQRHRLAYDVALPHLEEKLGHASVVKHWDLRVAALRGLVHTGLDGLADVKAVTRIMAAEGVRQNGEQTALQWGQEDGKRYTSITTLLHKSEEAEFVRLMMTAAADRSGAIPRWLLARKLEASGMDFTDTHGKAQRAAIEQIAAGGRFGLIIGAAGMGKTSALSPLVAAWREQGRDVWGTSLAWRQADDLALQPTNWSAGVDERQVKAFSVMLAGIESGDIKLNRNAVLAVDEFGMLGTRDGLALLRAQAKHCFSIVSLGDDKQCASIQAGPVIDLSRRALGAKNVPEILTTKRQKSEREREIVGLFREGRAAEALDMKRTDGTAEMVDGGRAGVIARVAKLYAERLAETGLAPGISAPTNQDAHDISAAVRIERQKLGLVGANAVTVRATDGERDYAMPLAPGDRVRLFKSVGARYETGRGGPIGRNGTVLDVVTADADSITLRNDKGKVGVVAWEKLAHGNRTHLAYGDAMTINTAQGSSKSEQISAFPDGTERVDGKSAYSGLTRHFHVSHLVTSDLAERIAVQKRRPLNDTREITAADKWASVARSFANQPQKDSATALAERVRSLRQGGIKRFQQALLPAEPAHRTGQTLSQGPEVARARKVEMPPETSIVRRTIRQGVEQTRQIYNKMALRAAQRLAPRLSPRQEMPGPTMRM